MRTCEIWINFYLSPYFQPWDNYPQTAFADRTVSDNSTENALLTRPFILADPEIVAPYSLAFKYNFANDSFARA